MEKFVAQFKIMENADYLAYVTLAADWQKKVFFPLLGQGVSFIHKFVHTHTHTYDALTYARMKTRNEK